MVKEVKHFMDEADIGSGEKTAAEIEDLEQTAQLKVQQEQARQQARPQDGSRLQQVVEEQQYLSDQEGHATQPSEQLHLEEQAADHDKAARGNANKQPPPAPGQPQPTR